MRLVVTLLISLLAATIAAHDYVPAKPQSQPILLKGGDLHTVSDGVMTSTDLLFVDGRIAQIGKNLTPDSSTKVIDVTGKNVYPGLIASNTALGLIEIGEVRATNDTREIGSDNPMVRASIAYNPDSELLPTVRSNGVTTALVVPKGRLITGYSFLVYLDGWTVEDATVQEDVGLHVVWPQSKVVTAWWEERSAEEQKKQMAENRARIYKVFENARSYHLGRTAGRIDKIDTRWEAMRTIFEGTKPVFIQANDYRQIEQAVQFARDYNFRLIITGGNDSWMLTDLLKANDVPVVLRRPQSLPPREDDGYDLIYRLPARLAEAGVKFCISTAGGGGGTAASVRNLPLQAGHAAGFGLSKEDALRAITLSPAEILGVGDRLGSLEVGKQATIVVSEGDILDMLGHGVVLEFISGRQVDLDNKHKELYRKYQQKSLPSQ